MKATVPRFEPREEPKVKMIQSYTIDKDGALRSIMLQSCCTYAMMIQKCYSTYCKNHIQRRNAQ